jgi:hypothetical protein
MNTNRRVKEPRPDVVTQAELWQIIRRQREQDAQCIAIRRRIHAGATVEPGHITAEAMSEALYPHDDRHVCSRGLFSQGLDLEHPAERIR